MCAYQSAKKNFTREEIIEILKKNVDLYKEDPNFTSYIVDLALYLVEFAYKTPDAVPSIMEKQDMDMVTQGPRKVYKVFRPPSSGDTNKFCPFCGAPVIKGMGQCQQCGNML